MKELKQAIAKHIALREERDNIYEKIREYYELDEEESVEYAIYQEGMTIQWDEERDIEYMDDVIHCQKILVDALEELNSEDNESLHNANKGFETIVHVARQIKKKRNEDIAKAQRQIDEMNRVIEICDKFRK